MSAYMTSNRIRVKPPSEAANGRGPAGRGAPRAPSNVAFIASAVFVTIAVVLIGALVATALPTEVIPLAIVLVSGLIATGLAVLGERWQSSRRRKLHWRRPPGLGNGARPRTARMR